MGTIKRTLSGIPNIFTIVFSGNTASGTASCNKTWQEVLDASSIAPVILIANDGGMIQQHNLIYVTSDKGYVVRFSGEPSNFNCIAGSADNYPQI